jgi:hypothetical protein
MSSDTFLRYLGNVFIIVGYQILLWGDFKYGLIFKIIGGICTLPFAIKLKLWDVVFLCSFFTATELTKLIQLYSVK